MKKGFAFIIVIAVIGLILIGGVSAFVAAKNFSKNNAPRKFDFGISPLPSGKKEVIYASPVPPPYVNATPNANSNQSLAPGLDSGQGQGTIYSQPQGKYKISLPSDWKFDSTNASATYSTTKFTGTSGNISITYGSGKDPLGGCSETTNIQLIDRTVPGCLLLQKDGSQILTRVYTKDSAGINYTIEAYINAQISFNRPAILNIIKTIAIY